jgi:predicted AlkP superfamily pyrophosphatase or phosphodiesterase
MRGAGGRTPAAVALVVLAGSVAVAAVSSFAQGAGSPTPTARPAPKSTVPKLTVVISVDGLSWATLDKYRPWYVAGLRRLLDESQVETETRYRHLNTETGPGHSSLSTGAPPRVTGIVGNRWLERRPDGSVRTLNCVDQPADTPLPGSFYRVVEREGRVHVFTTAAALESWEASGEVGRAIVRPGYGPKGETVLFENEDAVALWNVMHGRPKEPLPTLLTTPGPGNLRVPTLGDRVVETRSGARVVSISAKDRSALFLAGRDPRHTVFWFSQDSGRFVTSVAYTPPTAGRAVVDAFNTASMGGQLPARFGPVWKPLPSFDPPGRTPPARPTPMPALRDFQLPTNGLGWDHPLTVHTKGYFTSLYYSPAVDELVADLALAFVRNDAFALGRRSTPDMLMLSFSSQDTVSHSYGAESEENLDVLRRLDQQLGRLLDAFDRTYGEDAVVIAFSADHGFPLIPEGERVRNASFRGGRILTSERVFPVFPTFLERLNHLLSRELCVEPDSRIVWDIEGWNLLYNRAAMPLRGVAGSCGPAGRAVTQADVDRALPGVVEQFFGQEIERVYLVSERPRWPKDDPVTEFVENDYDAERSGDVFLIPRYGVMTHWDPARGAMHGSHHDYDTHVPLLFWGGPFKKATRTEPATPYDLAPTLAELFGVELKDAVGRSRLRR